MRGVVRRHHELTRVREQNFWRTSLGFWIQVMQQITGINLITYYAGESPLGRSADRACTDVSVLSNNL